MTRRAGESPGARSRCRRHATPRLSRRRPRPGQMRPSAAAPGPRHQCARLGLGSALVLLAGGGGNLANAVLHGSPHFSVGASTSVFAAVGVLGGLGVLRRWRKTAHRRRAWMPIAAALALLAMLGSGGERVDVWAHLFGLLLGGALGIVIGFTAPHPPALRIQWVCGSAALALLIYSWILALR